MAPARAVFGRCSCKSSTGSVVDNQARSSTVKHVVIAGGGTAGWIAATALSHHLGGLIDVTLVESEEIGTVGVGEFTIPTFRRFNALAGIDETDFVRKTQATFKLGISFEDWARIGDRYFHSFGEVGKSTWMTDFHHFWMHAREHGLADDLGQYCLELQAALAGKFAVSKQIPLNYAYHLDAAEYAVYLRAACEQRGVRRIEGRIEKVRQDGEFGAITALRLDGGAEIKGDLFIDCTGFRALLIEKTLDCGFEGWNQWLPTDRAIAVQTERTGSADPFTRAIAHQAGWQWRIPLQHRMGNGLVFCSQHFGDDEASALLDQQVIDKRITDPRLIRYRTGRRRQTWVKNCIALGLSSGFVEPLESTSIHLIQIAMTRLLQVFPFDGISDAVVTRFNAQCRQELESVRDFVILHYKLTERDDSAFWRCCAAMEVPDSLNERLALFREAAHAYQASEDLFRVDSWVQVMLGQHVQPKGYHNIARMMQPEKLQQAMEDTSSAIAGAIARLPTHDEFLKNFLVRS